MTPRAVVFFPCLALACAHPAQTVVPAPPSPAQAPAPAPIVEAASSRVHETCDVGAKSGKALRLSVPTIPIRLTGDATQAVTLDLRNDSDEPAALVLLEDAQGNLSATVSLGNATETRVVALSERDPQAPACATGQRVLTLDPRATVSLEMKLSAVQHFPRGCTCSPGGLCAMHAEHDEKMKKGKYRLVVRDASDAELRFDKEVKVEVAVPR